MDLAVTDDLYMRRPGVTDPDDQAILRPGIRVVSTLELPEILKALPEDDRPPEPVPGFYEMTPERMSFLMREGARTANEFEAHVRRTMTEEKAREVRDLRCVKHHSWRALSRECHLRWGGAWAPPSNQLMGMALCERAAEMLGEDAHALPWNDV